MRARELQEACVCVCGHWSSLVRSEKTLWPVGCSWIRKLSSINKCFVKKTVSNPSMIADSTKVIFATWKKKKDSKFQTWKAFFFFLINELWMWLWCDPAYWLYNTIQYNAANWDKNIVVVPTRNGWSYCKSRHHRSHGAVRREWLLIQTHCIKAKGIWKIMSWFLCNSFSYMGVCHIRHISNFDKFEVQVPWPSPLFF